MGEIKSTLDLVMERTRNLTLSESEKRRLTRADAEKRLRGFIQKFVDGWMDADAVVQAWRDAAGEAADAHGALFVHAVVAQMAPDRDNGTWLDLLGRFCGAPIRELTPLMASHEQAVAAVKREMAGEYMARLADAGISGTAVVPNLDADEAFAAAYAAAVDRFRQEVSERISGQLSGC